MVGVPRAGVILRPAQQLKHVTRDRVAVLRRDEILDDHELVKRIEKLYAADYDCFGYERKHERPDVTPTVQRGEFNYKKSGWQVYPKAYKGPSLRPA